MQGNRLWLRIVLSIVVAMLASHSWAISPESAANQTASDPIPMALPSTMVDRKIYGTEVSIDFVGKHLFAQLRSSVGVIRRNSETAQTKNEAVAATGVLVSREYVLTVSHVFPSRQKIGDFTFELDPVRADLESTPQSHKSKLIFELNHEKIVASTRGFLDYALVGLSTARPKQACVVPADNDSMNQLALSPRGLPSEGDNLRFVGFTDDDNFPNGVLAISEIKPLSSLNRFSKTDGTILAMDYFHKSAKGHSGSPILNSNGEWIGIHQRDLSTAESQDKTVWSPYLSHFYPCDKPPNLCATDGWVLPRQGTLVMDIADDIFRKKGHRWMLCNVPRLLTLVDPLLKMNSDRILGSESTETRN